MENILEIESVAEIEVDVESEVEIEVEIEQAGPQGKDGLSAYDIYIKNGGILTELEWLESLKGETGKPGKDGNNGIDGKNGTDGYTPIKGTDYWNEEDQASIKDYCNSYIEEQLGVIENGTY